MARIRSIMVLGTVSYQQMVYGYWTRECRGKKMLLAVKISTSHQLPMSERSHKLKEELDGIKEMEEESHTILAHVTALEDTLKGAKKPVCCIFLTLCAIIIMTL